MHAARRQSGFTLIEIMVVIVILGILASVVIQNVADRPGEAQVVKAKTDIRTLKAALDLYRLDNYSYPTTDQGLEALVTKPSGNPEPRNYKQGGYIDSLPKDPWGNEYRYLSPGEHGTVDIWSLGRDGAPGGEGIDGDIGSWDKE